MKKECIKPCVLTVMKLPKLSIMSKIEWFVKLAKSPLLKNLTKFLPPSRTITMVNQLIFPFTGDPVPINYSMSPRYIPAFLSPCEPPEPQLTEDIWSSCLRDFITEIKWKISTCHRPHAIQHVESLMPWFLKFHIKTLSHTVFKI